MKLEWAVVRVLAWARREWEEAKIAAGILPVSASPAGGLKAVDFSAYQGEIDFDKLETQGVAMVFIRCAFGSTKDKYFDRNWTEAKRRGFKRSAYCFYDYQHDKGAASPASQIAYWISILKSDPGEKPPAIDVEQPNGSWPELPNRAFLLDVIWQFEQAVIKLGYDHGILYTNPAMIHARIKLEAAPAWLLAMYLWIAHYYVDAPDIEPWGKWTAWQWGLGKGQGPLYGMASLDVDLDWVNADFVGGGTPPQEEQPMGIYSNRAKILYLWESHTNVDFSKLVGKFDAIAVFLGSGDTPSIQAKAQIKGARAAGCKCVLGYVELMPSCYEGYIFKPDAFPKGEDEPHVKMVHRALHWPDGTAEYVDGFIEDFSRHKMSDGKTWQTVGWNVAVASHVLGQLWAVHKKPISPLLKPFESDIPADYLNPGKEVATWLNSLGSVSIVSMAKATVEENGVKLPSDLDAPTIPFISRYDWWWFAAQLLDGLNTAGVVMIYRTSAAVMFKDLGIDSGGSTPPNNGGGGQNPPPAPTGDYAAVVAELQKLNAKVDTLIAAQPKSITSTFNFDK